MSVRLQTARLVIRPFEDGDADAWIAMFSDPEVRRFLPPAPVPTMETFAHAIESRQAMEREIGYAMWAVDDMTTRTFIGQCGIRPAKSMDENAGSEIDLAYHFARASWNRGYATEAAIAVLAHVSDRSVLTASWRSSCPKTSARAGSWRRSGCAIRASRTTTG